MLLQGASLSAFGFAGSLLGGANDGKVGDDLTEKLFLKLQNIVFYLLGVLCLAGTRFTGDQHGLVFAVLHHVAVGLVSHREEMGWPEECFREIEMFS